MKVYYGIDPGVQTGLARWVPSEKRFESVQSCNIILAMELIKMDNREKTIYLEDARLRKWFKDSPHGRDKKLQGVGSVKRDCGVWESFCKYYDVELVLVAPKDNETKTKADYFKRLTGWPGKTNEHGRDAGMLVFGRG